MRKTLQLPKPTLMPSSFHCTTRCQCTTRIRTGASLLLNWELSCQRVRRRNPSRQPLRPWTEMVNNNSNSFILRTVLIAAQGFVLVGVRASSIFFSATHMNQRHWPNTNFYSSCARFDSIAGLLAILGDAAAMLVVQTREANAWGMRWYRHQHGRHDVTCNPAISALSQQTQSAPLNHVLPWQQ